MSQSVEWARASSHPQLEGDPEWTDAYGTAIDEGNVGIWLDEVMIEGTVAEFRDLIQRLTDVIDGVVP